MIQEQKMGSVKKKMGFRNDKRIARLHLGIGPDSPVKYAYMILEFLRL